MNDTLVRLIYVLWFICFMATCYLGLHVVVAPLLQPGSKTTAFFTILTSPLTRPVRRLLGPGASEKRVRAVALAAVAAVCIVFRILLTSVLPAPVPR
jgi:hypothetical protein